MFLFVILVIIGKTTGYVWLHDNCTDDVNYMVPIENETVLDPCDDGECWTYCDHLEWQDATGVGGDFSMNHLESEQQVCIETGCADFHYAHINEIQLLEMCAIDKCHVDNNEVERVRPCSTLLIQASKLYKDVSELKSEFEQMYNMNRSLVENSKSRFITNINNMLTSENTMYTDLQSAATEMTKILEIKEPMREINMVDAMEEAMLASTEHSNQMTTLTGQMTEELLNMDLMLWDIYRKVKLSTTLNSALRVIKDYMDDLRSRVVHQYVYGPDECPDVNWLVSEIESECVLCENGACHWGDSNFTCICDIGWTGLHCEHLKTRCAENPCISAVRCVDEYETFRCECELEWTGGHCQTLINTTLGCDASPDHQPCQNEGLCVTEEAGYSCDCTVGFEGLNCQYALNDCHEQNPCSHGECVFENNRISCDCDIEPTYKQQFWKGTTCSIPQVECDFDQDQLAAQSLIHGAPCSGQGVCTLDSDNNGWGCFCSDGYIGTRCSVSVNETNKCILYNIPCIHGSCQHCSSDSSSSCMCECEAGYEGEQCSVVTNECEPTPCHNGATCIDLHIDYYCDCSSIPGLFGGGVCEQKITCSDKPCGEYEVNMVSCNHFSSKLSGIDCTCMSGWLGERCEIDARTCSDRVCLNGGNCAMGHSSAFCICPEGWEGERCERIPPFCDHNPCGSNGNCSISGTGYECHCDPGWEGTQCNYNIDDCSPNPCAHGACQDKVNDFDCLCADGWRGRHCDLVWSPCDNVSCPRNGLCLDTRLESWTEDSFLCMCAAHTCQLPSLGQTNSDTKQIRTKSHSYLLWGFVVGTVLMVVAVLFGYCVYCHPVDKRVQRQNFKHIHSLI